MNATYSPEDNKLRLYSSSRLDPETYARVKAAGFKWAPKQELFVAPMWTPSREDLLIELCGEIGDEDTSLVDRAEERADRFADYSEKRAEDAHTAHEVTSKLADSIPLGQPILIGHHSEKHARKDAEKIENGMRRAVKMWEQSQYWKSRAAGAIRAAKYKELPSVRARRIKGLEADQRKEEKEKANSERMIKAWETIHDDEKTVFKMKDGTKGDFIGRARFLSNYDHRQVIYANDTWWSAWDVLRPDDERYQRCPAMTPEEVQAKCIAAHTATVARCNRWLDHIGNRLEYERAMQEESGGTASDRTKPEKGGAVRCWQSPGHGNGWSYIVKVNKVSVSIRASWGNGHVFTTTMEFDKLKAVMSAEQVNTAMQLGRIQEVDGAYGFYLMESRDEFDAREPAPMCEPAPGEPDAPAPTAPEHNATFDAMRKSLKAGVKVVVAPQLFPTPPDLAARMVELADIRADHRVLEPSAGTGNILKLLGDQADKVAVEINGELIRGLLRLGLSGLCVHQGDFLECTPEELHDAAGRCGPFDRIVMNPPFENGADIKHITHALTFLKPGGRLVAICANGSRQSDKLRPIAEENGGEWEELPPDTFKSQGTGVRTVLLVIDKPEERRQGHEVQQAGLFA